MKIALLIIGCLSMVFAISFLMAAVLTFANYDQRPLDRDTDRMLATNAWLGRSSFIYVFVATRYWGQCQLGRRLFYVGLACGIVPVLCCSLAVWGV